MLIGSALTYYFSVNLIQKEDLREKLSKAYADVVVEVVNKGISEKYVDLAEAKARVAIYGKPVVVKALAEFYAVHGRTDTSDGLDSFYNMVYTMRNDLYGGKFDVDIEDIKKIISGSE